MTRWDEGDYEDARERWRRRRDERPGTLVAESTPDGRVQQDVPSQGPTVRISNRDAATYVLAVGGTLLRLEPHPYGRGSSFVFDDADQSASDALRRWGKRDPMMVDARDYAGAGALVRRVLRDGITGEVRYTVEGTYREHGCSA